jgi:hypothetical protein
VTREDRIVAGLNRALAHAGGFYTLGEVVQAAREGQAQIWERGDTVVVTELLRFPRTSVMNYWLVAGNREDFRALHPELEAWARRQGATRAQGFGRSGWARLTQPYGYVPHSTLYVKDFGP